MFRPHRRKQWTVRRRYDLLNKEFKCSSYEVPLFGLEVDWTEKDGVFRLTSKFAQT